MTCGRRTLSSFDGVCASTAELEIAQEAMGPVESELREGLERYWEVADRILAGSGIQLAPPVPEYTSLTRNFFSALFLYSYIRAQIPADRRILYVAVNQCLRGMVTGCDNILDSEYKMTLDTDLPAAGTRFRSVLDIMVSDRVLFEILLEYGDRHRLSADLMKRASAASLRALTRSGAQEASEEAGIGEDRLSPEEVLTRVHHFKTGLLFQCTWAIPHILEGSLYQEEDLMKDALYRIGIGCQIMDDLVDLTRDVKTRRHNYVASLVHHGACGSAKKTLQDAGNLPDSPVPFFSEHRDLLQEAHAEGSRHLRDGLTRLFSAGHQGLVNWAEAFITERIGVRQIIAAVEQG